ncbi:hypothetical protein IE53DRAFT_122018 [Violaceomyces palustris]|uniref:Uncharacterized protein n=1 Tax=Violaceomyces palustris TaxID=1673888 RepID=A0ACD0NVZ0_9BASI|nr:hypothetical protein IE53DRAFT_122018 [Violaceomyces palustris]
MLRSLFRSASFVAFAFPSTVEERAACSGSRPNAKLSHSYLSSVIHRTQTAYSSHHQYLHSILKQDSQNRKPPLLLLISP